MPALISHPRRVRLLGHHKVVLGTSGDMDRRGIGFMDLLRLL
jgi:hypothetical protein